MMHITGPAVRHLPYHFLWSTQEMTCAIIFTRYSEVV